MYYVTGVFAETQRPTSFAFSHRTTQNVRLRLLDESGPLVDFPLVGG